MNTKLSLLIIYYICSSTFAQRLNNSLQYDYNLLFTSTDQNMYIYNLSGSQNINFKSDEMILAHGLSYVYQKEIMDNFILGGKVGYLFSEEHFNRLVLGGNANYYLSTDYFTLFELNYGIGLWSNGSTHNPSRSVSAIYFTLGFGLHLKEYFALSLKYSRAINKEYGTYKSNSYGNSAKYYLDNMFTIATSWYF